MTKTICSDCHTAIHSTWTNKELEKTFHTVEVILSHPMFAKQIAFLRKQDPKRRCRMLRTRERQRRGRRGG